MANPEEFNPYADSVNPAAETDIQLSLFRRMLPWIKLVCALVLIACFFLPLSSCSKTVHIPVQDMQKSKLIWEQGLYLLVFYFPVVFLPLCLLVQRFYPAMVLTGFELLVAAYANFDIHAYIYFFRNPLPAGYLAVFAVTVYGLAVIIDGLRFFRQSEYDYYRVKYKLDYWGPGQRLNI